MARQMRLASAFVEGFRRYFRHSLGADRNHMESLCARAPLHGHDKHHRDGRRRPEPPHHGPKDRLPVLMLGAIGVVFGDIGTSPLYAMKESFIGPHPLAVDPAAYLRRAVADLLVADAGRHGQICRWSRCAPTISGEGGSFALLALISRSLPRAANGPRGLVTLGVLATCLFYGDAMITPAISVLSAVEGLTVVEAQLAPLVMPISIGILVGLFLIQARGTAQGRRDLRAGRAGLFRGAGGARRAQHHRAIRRSSARSTRSGRCKFFALDPELAFLALGSVVPGGDRRRDALCRHGPFRAQGDRLIAGSTLVYPCLMLNYLGQGALLLGDPGGGRKSLLPDGAGMGAAAAGRHRHAGDDHRQPGGDLRRLLGHPPGGPARLPAAPQDPPHQRQGGRADLHPGRQLDAAGAGRPAGARLPANRPTWPRPMASPSPARCSSPPACSAVLVFQVWKLEPGRWRRW